MALDLNPLNPSAVGWTYTYDKENLPYYHISGTGYIRKSDDKVLTQVGLAVIIENYFG